MKKQKNSQRVIKIDGKKASSIYLTQPVWLSLLKMSIPGILIVFLQSIFLFANQLMTVDLIPIDHVHSNLEIWGNDYQQTVEAIKNYNLLHPKDPLPIYTLHDIVKSANSFAAPLTSVVTASVMWSSQGSSSLYGRALGKKDFGKATDTYFQAIILGMVLTTLMLILLYGCAHVWISNEASAPHN